MLLETGNKPGIRETLGSNPSQSGAVWILGTTGCPADKSRGIGYWGAEKGHFHLNRALKPPQKPIPWLLGALQKWGMLPGTPIPPSHQPNPDSTPTSASLRYQHEAL